MRNNCRHLERSVTPPGLLALPDPGRGPFPQAEGKEGASESGEGGKVILEVRG